MITPAVTRRLAPNTPTQPVQLENAVTLQLAGKKCLFKYKYVRLKYFICPISFQFRPKPPGSTCRPAEHECDLSEYCNGDTEFCPNDIFKVDGTTCKTGKAYCYQGACRTHTDQVRKNKSWVEFEKSKKCLFHCIKMKKALF